MKSIFAVAAFLSALAVPAMAADFKAFHLSTDVAAPVDKVWSRIGGFCQMEWLGRGCTFSTGEGEIGTIRHLTNGAVVTGDEIMVAKTRYSYGYMVVGSPLYVHGQLSAEAIDPTHTRLTYTFQYDQSSLATDQDKAAAHDRRTKLFTDGLAKMKEIAEK